MTSGQKKASDAADTAIISTGGGRRKGLHLEVMVIEVFLRNITGIRKEGLCEQLK
jgi:hypothetical protein